MPTDRGARLNGNHALKTILERLASGSTFSGTGAARRRFCLSALCLAWMAVSLGGGAPAAHGAARTWSGAGTNGLWTNPFNWSGEVAPVAGDDLLFPAGAMRLSSTNNFPQGTDFGSFQFSGGDYNFYGNSVDLTGGVTFSGGAGTNSLFLSLQLRAPQAFDVAGSGATLVVEGNITLGANLLTVQGTGDTELRDIISGSGAITKEGVGTLSLRGTAPNTYSGLTSVNRGVLFVGRAGALGNTSGGTVVNNDASLRLGDDVVIGAEPLTLNSSGLAVAPAAALESGGGSNSWAGPITLAVITTVNVNAGEFLNLRGAISGPGGLVKIGANTLILSGGAGSANTYAGATLVETGTLLLAKTIPNAAVPGALLIGDEVGGSAVDVVRLAVGPQIRNTSFVSISASGLLDLNDESDEVGALEGFGGANLALGSGTLTFGQDDSSTEFIGSISGSGGLVKEGTGRFTLIYISTHTGPTVVNNGKVVINGSQPDSPVTVNAAGTLAGTGVVGTVNVVGGTVTPGSSLGVLSTSNLTLNAAGKFEAELDGSGAGALSDQLNVSGAVALGNSDLHLSLVSAPLQGQQFTLINNDGADAVTGIFGGLPNGAILNFSNLQFHVNYNGGSGNDVVLTLTNTPMRSVGSPVVLDKADGTVLPNECVMLNIVLTNVTPGVVSGIMAALTPRTPGVSVVQRYSSYPDLPSGGQASNDVSFQIVTTPEFLCGTNIELLLTVTSSGNGSYSIPIQLPSGAPQNAAVFNASIATPIPDNGAVTSMVAVTGIASPVAKITVALHITHESDADLAVALISPGGTRVELATSRGGTGDNYGTGCSTNDQTTFDDGAALPISAGTAPFVGQFRPEKSLAAFHGLAGTNVNGDWQLVVTDAAGDSVAGTLDCWSVTIFTGCGDGGGPCLLCPDQAVAGSISTVGGSQAGRLFRDFNASVCASNKACPEPFQPAVLRRFNSYPFVNGDSAACITVTLRSQCHLMSAAYLNRFNPSNICENYLGDIGQSAIDNIPISYSFDVPAQAAFVVVVNEVFANMGCDFTLEVTGGDCRPVLNITQVEPDKVVLEWPVSAQGYRLVSTNNLPFTSGGAWMPVTNAAFAISGRWTVTNAVTGSNVFYRLRKP